MFISKKEYSNILKRIESLEKKVEAIEDNSECIMYNYGRMNFKSLCKKLTDIIRVEIKNDKKSTLTAHMRMLENK